MGVVFFTVGATVAILSPYDEPKIDSRPLIFLLASLRGPARTPNLLTRLAI